MARREEGGEEASSDGGQPELSRKEFTLLLVRDIAIAGTLVAIVFGTMFAYTQVWPPVVVVESGTIEIVGTLRGARVTTTAGLRSDDPSSRIETTYGRPGALDGLQALNVWGYPTRGLAVLVLNDRVQAVWSGRVTPR